MNAALRQILGFKTLRHAPAYYTNMVHFKRFTVGELVVLYDALYRLMDSQDCRRYLHNADPGHPVYLMGTQGRIPGNPFADSPQHNELYRVGCVLHAECLSRNIDFFEEYFPTHTCQPFASWKSFCEAVTAIAARK